MPARAMPRFWISSKMAPPTNEPLNTSLSENVLPAATDLYIRDAPETDADNLKISFLQEQASRVSSCLGLNNWNARGEFECARKCESRETRDRASWKPRFTAARPAP